MSLPPLDGQATDLVAELFKRKNEMTRSFQDIGLSIIIPVFNEEKSVPKLYEALEKVLRDLELSYEIIFVNDGSRDRSEMEVERLHLLDPCVKLISLSRNFGHQAALSAGLDFAQGSAVVMMDGDLQHPPEIIPSMVKKWKEGYEIVFTIREEMADANRLKRLTSTLFYWLINRMTGTPIPAGAADFRLLDRKVVEEILKLKEQSRFYRGLVSWLGFCQIGIPYNAPARLSGVSEYTLRRMMRFAMDGITSFSAFPLRISMYLGFLVSGISFIYGVYTLFVFFFSIKVVPGWASLMIVVLFIGGIQLITLGILGEYIGRIYDQVKGRPLYIVQKKLGELVERKE